ncbi:hypothetical protein [Aliiroseovarius subalbicans]|uniref:hypothetical protein n=1 Tax=Aliiroseovarius subalbicans TaxID=2925840 RepID=UPI001F5A909F|nr:hypothetical protein [Aliiroseovarius subalbicans]MCI2400281.1 hypothetical protein [Aliiroseovarius subalbicans]
MTTENRPVRRVTPRNVTLASTLVVAGFAVADLAPVANPLAAPALAAGGEGGEAGEAGIEMSDGPSVFLTQLGYFEGTYRIAATLFLEGNQDAAREHLEMSHHAFYEDIEEALTHYDAPGFSIEADAFLHAIANDAPDADVTATLDALLAALTRTATAAQAPAREQVLAIRNLVALAAAEYEGGVDEGRVEVAIEYRDSWGFLETARHRAQLLADGADANLVKAGRDALEQMDGLEVLYPGLTADTASSDPSSLAGAAAWIEIIALRLR